MKTIIFILAIVLITTETYAQTNMVVRTKAGTYTAFSISDIDIIDFAPCGIVDYGGQTYYTVKIGNQCWLRENLDIGTMINSSTEADSMRNNGIKEKYCYDDDPNNCNTYGGLYQWNEAMQYVTTEGAQGICPSGWHLPTLAEFEALAAAVNNDGNALKAVGQGTGGGAGTNKSGFSLLLAGYRFTSGYFGNLGGIAGFWSSTEDDEAFAYGLTLNYSGSNVTLYGNDKGVGFSVRCLKD